MSIFHQQEQPCENGGISIGLFLLVFAALFIILSTIDFHTGLIWSASPRVNAEARYIVTIFSIAIMFVYMYCQHIRLQGRVQTLQRLLTDSSVSAPAIG